MKLVAHVFNDIQEAEKKAKEEFDKYVEELVAGTEKIKKQAELQLMALAGASTLSGGISLLGAASNVIVLEQAESRGTGFGFVEFSKIGLLVTIPNLLILYLFLRVL